MKTGELVLLKGHGVVLYPEYAYRVGMYVKDGWVEFDGAMVYIGDAHLMPAEPFLEHLDKYIFECIEKDGTSTDKLRFFAERFKEDYGSDEYKQRYPDSTERMYQYLTCCPSCFSIDLEPSVILMYGKKWGLTFEEDYQETVFLEEWETIIAERVIYWFKMMNLI